MDFLNHIAPPTNPKKNTARKVPNRVPKPGAKAAKATSIDLQPINNPNSDMEMDSSQDEDAERAMQPTGPRATLLRGSGSTLKTHQELTDLPNPGTLKAVKRCDTCHDTGKKWQEMVLNKGLKVVLPMIRDGPMTAQGLSLEPMAAVSQEDGGDDNSISTPADAALKRKRVSSMASTLSEQGATSKKIRDRSSTQNPLASLTLDCIFDFSNNISSSSGAGLE
ncbi:hypothetical protein HD554DRAFT_2176870 [Boletus coccyginus]|nr:hypothetical protein HD554DRAFT_2176870 [Boletus coccyginus]